MTNYDLFIIVNVADLGDHPRDDLLKGLYLPVDQRPTFIHTDRERACHELLRLSLAHPHGKFVLFDAILFSRRKDISHIPEIQHLGEVFEVAPIEELAL